MPGDGFQHTLLQAVFAHPLCNPPCHVTAWNRKGFFRPVTSASPRICAISFRHQAFAQGKATVVVWDVNGNCTFLKYALKECDAVDWKAKEETELLVVFLIVKVEDKKRIETTEGIDSRRANKRSRSELDSFD